MFIISYMPELVLHYCTWYCSLTTLIILCILPSLSSLCHLTVDCKCGENIPRDFCLSPSADAKVMCAEVSEHIIRDTDKQSKYTFQTILKMATKRLGDETS